MKELYLLSDMFDKRHYEIIEPKTFNKIIVYDYFGNGVYHDYESNTYEMIISKDEDGTINHYGMIKTN